MPTSKKMEKDALLAELDLHKAEFTALREEILSLMESERQYLNLSLIAFGGGIGIAPFLSTPKTYVILLLIPFVFHVLLWEMLKSMRSVGWLSSYLMGVLIPRVNVILDLLGRENDAVNALGWELHINSRHTKTSAYIISSLTPTRHWIPILAVGALVITYLVLVQNAGYVPSLGELVLVLLNLGLLIMAAIQNLSFARSTLNSGGNGNKVTRG